ncbi:MAG: MBOAT family protein [Chloroflexi bacterium]|nr:MBOAT family protein [Chloroflexota bacterium]
MRIEEILLIAVLIILSRIFFNETWYRWAIFIFSLVAIYWFQPLSPIRYLDFWLPTILLLLTIICWSLLFHQKIIENMITLGLLIGFLGILVLGKFTGFTVLNAIVSTPGYQDLALAVVLMVLAYFSFNLSSNIKKLAFVGVIGFVLFTFIVLKSGELGLLASQILRRLNGQLITLANPMDIAWIGYSFFSFRLLHSIFERKRIAEMGLTLREYFTYLVFFPAFIAGPIDRVDSFSRQLRSGISQLSSTEFLEGFLRITRGILLKFVLADSIALLSLNSQSINQIQRPLWTWIIVYGYAFRLFFDFAGYTDIAIGLGKMAGIQLSENFNQPYLSRNVTVFWNRWHITLTQWFRTYYFNPVTRFFRSNFSQVQPWMIIFFSQITTMLLIGLWHGISWNFVLWGFWNGIGLFLHNRWSTIILPKFEKLRNLLTSPSGIIISTILTFNFIALGWVWFALPTTDQSIKVFRLLFRL